MRLAVLVAPLSWIVACGAPPPCPGPPDFVATPVAPYASTLPETGAPFIVVADTQRTSFVECAVLGRRTNDALTQGLLEEIGALDPAFVAILGDLVFDAGDAGEWAWFDHLMTPIRSRGIPVLPVRGNHEYWQWPWEAAEEHIAARFPALAGNLYYARTFGRLGLVWLDTNHEEMDAKAWAGQLAWFEGELARFAAEPEVKGILVLTHHPPYSRNPFTRRGDDRVRDELVPIFLRSPKTLAFLSGHAHGYEHFAERRRHFIVSGGGGGPRPDELMAPLHGVPTDRFTGAAPRPFNYLHVSQDPTGATIEARGKDGPEEPTRVLETIRMEFPR